MTWIVLPQRFRDNPHLFAQALSQDLLDLDLRPNGKILQYVDSSILAWKVPRTEEPGGLQSMGLRRLGHD